MDRFEPDLNTGCWLWTGPLNKGYGKCQAAGKTTGAHRVFYELFSGPIPDGLFVCHRCDTPLCVNPAHLFLGTPADNVQDALKKGRHRAPRGEANGLAVLSEAQVLAIYTDARTQGRVAAEYGVHPLTVSRIKTGKSWGWLTDASGLRAHRRPGGRPRGRRVASPEGEHGFTPYIQ